MSLELSVVIPMFNEEEVLPLLVERLRPILDGLHTSYEVVAVDDGSSDLTPALLQRFHREWRQLRVVRLRANAGHQAAISAGLVSAQGDYVATIDADLQDPPEVIAEMLEVVRRERVDVVYGVRSDRSTDTAFKRLTAKAFYALIKALSGTTAHSDAGDYRLMSRATVEAINALPESNRVLRFIVPAFGFPSETVEYRREERAAGTSKYPFAKMLKLSLDSVTGFSLAPLRLATYLGLGGGVFAIFLGVFALIARWQGRAVAGWTSTVLIVASVGAAQLLCLGLLGEYVGRMYRAMQARPTYFIAYDSLTARVGRADRQPAVEAPAVEAPAVEAPAVEAPAVEAPAVEAGVTS
ncbi:MAG TPA: glycosyltransferase family 2 protein [Candidatus Lustribacter sp.]|nr:glycosyltransferase family 2 protein [Candidatus Lustribacter sp.]